MENLRHREERGFKFLIIVTKYSMKFNHFSPDLSLSDVAKVILYDMITLFSPVLKTRIFHYWQKSGKLDM